MQEVSRGKVTASCVASKLLHYHPTSWILVIAIALIVDILISLWPTDYSIKCKIYIFNHIKDGILGKQLSYHRTSGLGLLLLLLSLHWLQSSQQTKSICYKNTRSILPSFSIFLHHLAFLFYSTYVIFSAMPNIMIVSCKKSYFCFIIVLIHSAWYELTIWV